MEEQLLSEKEKRVLYSLCNGDINYSEAATARNI